MSGIIDCNSVQDHPLGEERDEDEREKAAASWSVFWTYFKTGGGICGFVLFVIFCVLVQVSALKVYFKTEVLDDPVAS